MYLAAFWVLLQIAGSAQPILYIEKGVEQYSIDKYLSVLEDKSGTLDIETVSSDSFAGRFKHYDKKSFAVTFSESPFWLRLIIKDTLTGGLSGTMGHFENRTWLLITNDPMTENISFFHRAVDNSKLSFVEIKSGRAVPVAKKSMKLSDFVASFSVYSNRPDTVYLRVQTVSQVIFSFNLISNGAYIIHSSQKNMLLGISFGIFFLLVTYNLILYYSIRNKIYLYYVLYIVSFSIFIFIYHGHYSEIIGYTFFRDYYRIPIIFITLAATFWIFLTREFLTTKIHFPVADKILVFFIPVSPLICFVLFAFTIPSLVRPLAVSFLIYYIFGLIIAILAMKKKVFLAKYYLLALAGITISIAVSVSARNNFFPLPWNFWTVNAISLGILWEGLILAGSVGYMFNNIKSEKEKEKALIRNQIAADLHDEIGSNLSTISLQSRVMMSGSNLDSDSKEQLQNISSVAGVTTETIRDIVWFINPRHDSSSELFLRMKELASKMLAGCSYTFTSDRNEEIFNRIPDLNKRRHIYLIFKETLNNIVKHADATAVNILMTESDNTFILSIADNGKGFRESEVIHGEGLQNLRNRAHLSGGRVSLTTTPGGGTTMILEVPL